jgi:pimeloyl-ACP methyl ester carboxylesterase
MFKLVICFILSIANAAGDIPGWCCKSNTWHVVMDDTTHSITMIPKGEHNMTVIFLHGAGGSSWAYFPLFEKDKVAPKTAKIILLQAPSRMNGGRSENLWFDVKGGIIGNKLSSE